MADEQELFSAHRWPVCMASNLPRATATFPEHNPPCNGAFQSSKVVYSTEFLSNPAHPSFNGSSKHNPTSATSHETETRSPALAAASATIGPMSMYGVLGVALWYVDRGGGFQKRKPL
jgi:hypothetical protein